MLGKKIVVDAALYHSERIIQDKPTAKPNYWVMAKLNNKNSIVTIELSETKDNYEIVGWRYASMKSIQQIKNRAEREGGQVLITERKSQGSSGLYDLPSSFNGKIQQETEKVKSENEKNQKKLHISRPRQQINPIVREGKIKVRCSFIKTIRLITKFRILTNNYKARIGEKEKKFVSTSFFPFPLQVITFCTYC